MWFLLGWNKNLQSYQIWQPGNKALKSENHHSETYSLKIRQKTWNNPQSFPVTKHDLLFSEIPSSLPLWLKIPSISMLLREWAMQSMALGTNPSWAGERSVVRTRHQSGLSRDLSSTSTVWPRFTLSSEPLLAMKSWMTTVNSQPPDSCGRQQHTSVYSRKGLQKGDPGSVLILLPVWSFGYSYVFMGFLQVLWISPTSYI